MSYTILITGGGGVTGRAVARSLRLSAEFAKSELIACDIFSNKFGVFEGLFNKYIKMPHVDNDKYESAFLEVINEYSPDVVLIMTEKEALFWSERESCFPTIISPFAFSEIAVEKSRLYSVLNNSGLVPKFEVVNVNSQKIEDVIRERFSNEPVWLRCYDIGSTSGKGAFKAETPAQANAWQVINPGIINYLISSVLPGRNYACNMLFFEGELIQSAIYERLEYFMGKVAPSGITGNICLGRLVNEQSVLKNSLKAIKLIESYSLTKAHGIYTVDLKEDSLGFPMITEINLRHTAATSSFAQGGCNMAEFQVFATLKRLKEIPKNPIHFPEDNLLFRDIDGLPIYVSNVSHSISTKLIDKSTLLK